MNIILCGLPKCGKTAVGKMLAKACALHFIDCDTLIEQIYFQNSDKHLSCRQIFDKEGEESFRKLEKEALMSLEDISNSVIALGGGALETFKEELSFFKKLGYMIYLRTPLEVIWQRISHFGRPAYLSLENSRENFYNLAKMRLPLYETAADIIVDANNFNEQEIVEAILRHGK